MRCRWSQYGFNDRTYCDKVRRTIEPYDQRRFYLDLFDFAVVDALMYHFDSKHYSLGDHSRADGLVVRLDHGRASVFCRVTYISLHTSAMEIVFTGICK